MARLDVLGVGEALRLLPRLLAELRAIHEAVVELNEEVRLMRQGVERIRTETQLVGEAVAPLDGRLDEVAGAITRLEPQIAEVSDAIHPLRRATGLITRRNAREGNGRPAAERAAERDGA